MADAFGNHDSLDEASFYGEKDDPIATAKRLIREGAPFAATSIINMASDDTIAPSVKLRAAQYIVDRNLGPVGGQGDGAEDLLQDFLQELNDVANGKAPRSQKK